MLSMTSRAAERVVDHLATLRSGPTVDLAGGAELTARLDEPLPRDASDFDATIAFLFDRVIPVSINTAHPGMLSYVQGGGLFHAALADFVSLAVNRYVGYSAAAPGLAALEAVVARWFCDLLGFPEGAGGALTSGGSIATLMAIAAARTAKLETNHARGCIYASDQAHHAIPKAARIAGLGDDAVRVVPCDDRFRIDLGALRQQITADRAAGLHPFMIVGSAGTTSSGAVDDLEGLADIARDEGLWFHVDGAYGGFFVLTDRGKRALVGIGRADSVVLDPHKSLFLPYGTGAIVVRDVETLRRAHELHSDYVEGVRHEEELAVDVASITPELTRDARGLRVWLPLKLLGADTFRAALDEKLDLASYAADKLRAMPGVTLLGEPELSTVAFWVTPRTPGADPSVFTDRVVDHVNARGRVHLSSTNLLGRRAIRICVLSFRAHKIDVESALEDLSVAFCQLET